jgi:hypothetical protein
MQFESSVHGSTRRVTPSFLSVDLGLFVCFVASRGEGPASRAFFKLGLCLSGLSLSLSGLSGLGLSVLKWGDACVDECCDAEFESFVFKG